MLSPSYCRYRSIHNVRDLTKKSRRNVYKLSKSHIYGGKVGRKAPSKSLNLSRLNTSVESSHRKRDSGSNTLINHEDFGGLEGEKENVYLHVSNF